MKALGCIFILVSSGYIGFHATYVLKNRIKVLRLFLECLQITRNEIAFCGTPVPKIFDLLSVRITGELSKIFAELASVMEKNKMKSPSEAASVCLSNCQDPLLTEYITMLTSSLGDYDIDAQITGIARVKSQVEAQLEKLEIEEKQKGKVYQSLGICAGLALVILFI